MMENLEMIAALLQAILGQDPNMQSQGAQDPSMQMAQYGGSGASAGRGQMQMPVDPYSPLPGVSSFPKQRFESNHPKQRFESNHPKQRFESNHPRGAPQGGSVGDDFFSDPRFKGRY